MNDIPQSCSSDIFRKNVRFLRKYYKLTQQDVAEKIGCTRGSYQHCESKGSYALFLDLCSFWYKNYGITPNDILFTVLDENGMEKIKRRIKNEKAKRKVTVRVKIKSNR